MAKNIAKNIAPHIYRSIADIDFDLDANGDLSLHCDDSVRILGSSIVFRIEHVLALRSFFQSPNVDPVIDRADLKAQRKADRSFKISEQADCLLVKK